MYSRIQEQDLLGQDPEIRRLWQRSIRGLLIVFGAVALWACDSAPQPDQVLISNVHIVDPVEGLVPDQQVLIEAGQIISVENSGAELPANPNRKVRDAAGQFLTPGLWDMHVHFVFDPALTNEMADLFLDYGINACPVPGIGVLSWPAAGGGAICGVLPRPARPAGRAPHG